MQATRALLRAQRLTVRSRPAGHHHGCPHLGGWIMRAGVFLAIGLCGLAASGRGSDWPQFRGPDGNGGSTEPNLPPGWGAKQNFAWKAELPGVAWSCPIVVGDKVFVTTAVTDKQQKPKGGFGGGFGPGGGPGGFPGGPGGKKGPDAVYQWKVICLDRATG